MLIRSSGTGCPVCGNAHAACGPAGTGTPVDIPTREDRAMGATRKYHVTHNGHRTIMKLNDADVKLYPDAEPVAEPTTADDAEQGDETADDTGAKARTPANKARRPAANKQQG